MYSFNTFIRTFILLAGVCLCQNPLLAQDSWKLKTDKDGVQVYTQSHDNSPFKKVKTVCTLQTSLSKVAAVIMDVMHTPEWVYGTKTCSVLKRESPTSLYYYAEMGLPWPASNRDFIIRISLSQNERTKLVTILAENKPDFIPEKKGLVRIQQSSGVWMLTPLSGGLVRVEYVLQVDPGGVLPSSVVNMFSFQGPFESFKNLKKQINKPAYNKVQFPNVKD